jgi:hypothetical protein
MGLGRVLHCAPFGLGGCCMVGPCGLIGAIEDPISNLEDFIISKSSNNAYLPPAQKSVCWFYTAF